MNDIVYLVAGLVLLVAGGELLVRGASQTAERLGMSPLLIGLTLVGFGTSTPELVTSVQAALAGSPGIAVGNIVGSNIANVLLILGISALLFPIAVSRGALRRDGMVVLATAILFALLAFMGGLTRIAGVAFVIALAAYLYFAYRQEKAGATDGHTAALEKAAAHDEALPPSKPAGGSLAIPLAIAMGGLVLVVAGGNLLVGGAIGIARAWGISETVIGLTIVAIGTSLPELVTSVVAALRRHSDVAIGNVLGSNIYNILGIGGVTALIAPTDIPEQVARFDAPVMVAVSVALLLVAFTGSRITRWEGAALVAGYAAYVYAIWP